jgi:hypothetical protein
MCKINKFKRRIGGLDTGDLIYYNLNMKEKN